MHYAALYPYYYSSGSSVPTVNIESELHVFNEYILLTFPEGVYKLGGGAVEASDLSIVFSQNSGAATDCVIASISAANGDPLAGGETVIRVNLTFTGSPSGVELIIITGSLEYSDETEINATTGEVEVFITYHADYKLVLEYAIAEEFTYPEYDYRKVENARHISWDNSGVLTRHDAIWPLSIYGDENYAFINFKSPGDFQLTREAGTGGFTTGVGFSAGTVLHTGFVPTTDGVEFTLDDASVTYYAYNNVQDGTGMAYGTRHSDNVASKRVAARPRNASDIAQISLNCTLTATAGSITGVGLVTQTRSSNLAADHDYFINGSIHDASNNASSALPDREILIGADWSTSGVITSVGTWEPGLLMVGSDVADLADEIDTIWDTFLAANALVEAGGSPTEILSEPEDANIVSGQPGIFTVAVSTEATYQWQEDSGGGFANVTDGGIYSGATTSSLTITTPTLNYNYRCVITGNAGIITSATATVAEIAVFPAWETNTNNWTDFANALANLSQTQTEDISQFGSLPGNDKYRSGAAAPNGCIYLPPYGANVILKLDTNTDTISEIGSFPGATLKFSSAILSPDGVKIYCIPYQYGKILVIDTSDDTYYELGEGLDTFIGAVLANNGWVYGVPYGSATIVKVNTADDTVEEFGNIVGAAKCSGGVLGSTGKIYCAPYNAAYILIIDPSDDSTDISLTHSGTGATCNGGAISSAGIIYLCPFSHNKIIRIDTSDDTLTEFGTVSGGSFKYRGFITGANKIIYGVPYNATSILRLDPDTEALSLLGTFSSDSSKWLDGALGHNGSIYMFPHYAETFLKILSERTDVPEDFYLSRYVNKY